MGKLIHYLLQALSILGLPMVKVIHYLTGGNSITSKFKDQSSFAFEAGITNPGGAIWNSCEHEAFSNIYTFGSWQESSTHARHCRQFRTWISCV